MRECYFRMNMFSIVILLLGWAFGVTKVTAQSFGPLGPFIASDAEVLLAFQPQSFMEDESARSLVKPYQFQEYLPAELGKVQSIVMAGDCDTLYKLCVPSPFAQFQNIAKDIHNQKESTPVTEPSTANLLNRPFVALVVFEESINETAVSQWLCGKSNATLDYRHSNRDGQKVFESKSPDTCLVIQVDSKTLIIGGKQMIESGLSGKGQRTSRLVDSLDSLLKSEDLTIVADIGAMFDKSGTRGQHFIAASFPGIDNMEQLRICLDFDGVNLVSVEGSFPNESDAQLSCQLIQKRFRQQLAEIKQLAVGAAKASNDDDDIWLTQKSIEVLDSVSFENSENLVIFKLPRPEKWTELVRRYSEFQRKVAEQSQAAFEEVAKQLKEAEDAASEAAKDAFDSIADDLK